MNTKLATLCASLCGFGYCSTVQADLIITGAPGQPGTVRITHDLTYKITSAGDVSLIALDSLVPVSDGTQSQTVFSNPLSLRVNETPAQSGASVGDNVASPTNQLTPTDGFILLYSPVVTAVGDTVTVQAQTLKVDAFPANFNQAAFGTFKGRSFLADGLGNRSSKSISVNYPTYLTEKGAELYVYYAGIGKTNLGLSKYYEYLALAQYHFHLDLDRPADAEFNLYKYKGLSLRFFYQEQGKPKLGRYFQFLRLGLAHKRFWILKGNPRKGDLLYARYLALGLAARR